MVTDYLKEIFGAPRRVKRVFFLNKKQKQKRLTFCKEIMEKNIKGENIFFTDEQPSTSAHIVMII